ncbi:MAG: ABC transporter ATP-binding protein [Clostridia bacterium]|nr:ABC transporter ATP-binding protein [Clostridia bacterium]
MPSSKAHIRAVAKYSKENYDDLRIRVPKGRRADIEAAVKEKNLSINGVVNQLLREFIGMTEEEWKNREEE